MVKAADIISDIWPSLENREAASESDSLDLDEAKPGPKDEPQDKCAPPPELVLEEAGRDLPAAERAELEAALQRLKDSP
jgi:hypothetical protein